MIGAELDWQGIDYDFSRFVPRCLVAQETDDDALTVLLNGLRLPFCSISVNEEAPGWVSSHYDNMSRSIYDAGRLTVNASTPYEQFKHLHLAHGDDATLTIISGWSTVLVADMRLVEVAMTGFSNTIVNLEFSGVRRSA